MSIRSNSFVHSLLAVAALALALTAGCENGSRSAAPEAIAGSKTPAAASSTDDSPEAIKVTVDESGRKWLTPTIPYDVFPDVPTDEEVAAGEVGGRRSPVLTGTGPPPISLASKDRAEMSSTAEASVVSAPAVAEGMPAAEDQPISLESLQREISTVRNSLSENLLTVGNYNASFEAVAQQGWLMSALATMAIDHPGVISWKENALLARDASVAVATAATGRGRQNFNDAQLAAEQVAAVLDNNAPPGLATPDAAASREETADRAALMTRMQTAFDVLKGAAADDATFKKDLDGTAHEAILLAALARFTAHGDYGSADEPDYRDAANELAAAGGAMARAAAGEDRTGFAAAFDLAGAACNKCHEKYRFSP